MLKIILEHMEYQAMISPIYDFYALGLILKDCSEFEFQSVK